MVLGRYCWIPTCTPQPSVLKDYKEGVQLLEDNPWGTDWEKFMGNSLKCKTSFLEKHWIPNLACFSRQQTDNSQWPHWQESLSYSIILKYLPLPADPVWITRNGMNHSCLSHICCSPAQFLLLKFLPGLNVVPFITHFYTPPIKKWN